MNEDKWHLAQSSMSSLCESLSGDVPGCVCMVVALDPDNGEAMVNGLFSPHGEYIRDLIVEVLALGKSVYGYESKKVLAKLAEVAAPMLRSVPVSDEEGGAAH